MCGIIGIIGKNEVAPLLIEGLRRLEYRGYDSAGVATLVNGRIDRRRAEGKLVNLDRRVQEQPLSGTIGIGHTRWATHGGPTETNAHPHATRKVAVVHNGIIENYQDLKAELEGHHYVFETQTDTEVIVHLVTSYLDQGLRPVDATAEALKRLEGAFSLALIFAGEHDLMIGARRGTPLAVGYGNGNDEMYLASDAFALAPLTNRLSYLEDGDWVVLNRGSVVIRNAAGEQMPEPMLEALLKAQTFNQGFLTVQQLSSAILDMRLHQMTELPQDFDARTWEAAQLRELGVPEEIGMRHRLPHFSHIFDGGYSASYYAYTWAEAMDADGFDAFKEAGNVFDPELAAKLRREVYEVGNTRDPAESYRAFRGRMPTADALLRNRGLK